MAIHRRDRSFSNIINDVEVGSIPMHFIKSLVFILQDGTRIEFDHYDIAGFDSIESMLAVSDYADMIADIKLEFDFESIEADVTSQVSTLLNKKQ